MNEHMDRLRQAYMQAGNVPDSTNNYVPGSAEKPENQKETPPQNKNANAPEPSGWVPEIHGNDEVECFGSRIFRSEDQNRQPVIRVVTDSLNKDQEWEAEAWYNRLGRMKKGKFLHRTNTAPMKVGRYTVFDFEIGNQVFSLGELHRQHRMSYTNPELILGRLNELIIEYRMELAQSKENYRSLNCLSMETVFIDMDNNIKVLPVYTCGNRYPIEIAREVFTRGQKTDERSDLYAAAYVAVEAFSDSTGDREIQKPKSRVILDCLQPIRDWRPFPDEVRSRLQGKHPVPRTKVGGVPKDKKNDRQNTGNKRGAFWEQLRAWAKKLRLPEAAEEEIHIGVTCPPGVNHGQRRNEKQRPPEADDSWDERENSERENRQPDTDKKFWKRFQAWVKTLRLPEDAEEDFHTGDTWPPEMGPAPGGRRKWRPDDEDDDSWHDRS